MAEKKTLSPQQFLDSYSCLNNNILITEKRNNQHLSFNSIGTPTYIYKFFYFFDHVLNL